MKKRSKPSASTIIWQNIYPKSVAITESPEFKALPLASQVLYDVLCRLRYALRDSEKDNSFWRSDIALIRDSGMARNTLKRARQELVANNLIAWQSLTTEKHRPPRYVILDDVHTQQTQGARDLNSMPYRDYLETSHWQATRKTKLAQARYSCELCSATNTLLNVHHKHYRTRGHESNHDLIALCEPCHAKFHDKLPGDKT